MRKKQILFLLPVLLWMGLSACRAQTGKYSADKKAETLYLDGFSAYVKGDYPTAAKNAQKAVERDPNFREAFLLLGDASVELRQYEAAADAYRRSYEIDPQRGSKALALLAGVERALGRFKDAEKHYREYLNYAKDPQAIALTRRNIEVCIVSDSLLKHPISFVPKNLGPEINTAEGEYGPSIRADGQVLIFTRRGKFPTNGMCPTGNGGQTEEMFISQKNGDNWGKAINMGPPLNTPCNEGAQSISADGQYMFFAAAGREINGRIFQTLDLYWTRRKGNNWEVPANMGGVVNTGARETQPCISSDGKTLYFVSTRAGGYGGSDIYSSTLGNDGVWGKPVNMGPNINTPGEEFSPFIHPDDQTLYFASDYWPGLGNFDLFYSRKDAKGQFGKPVNMGSPLNTPDDEYSLVVSADGQTGYFASTTIKGYGDYDLYAFEMPPAARPVKVSYMKGIVSDAKDKKFLEASFELIDLKTGQTVVKSQSDRVTGDFLVCIPANRDYALNVSKDGYLFHSENFSLTESSSNEPFTKNVELTPIAVGVPVVLRNVFFETGSAALKNESRVELDKLVDMLRKNPNMKIEVSGHTDNVGSKESNLKLSDNRAASVKDYLVKAGIQADRITTKGFGDTKPVDDNGTDKGRANNRRTEFKVTNI